MDQLHPSQPPQTPQPTSQAPTVESLPHLVVDNQKRSPLAIGGIVVLSLIVLAIPLAVFLVQQRTKLQPKAAVIEEKTKKESSSDVVLESKFSIESKGGIIPVDVYVKSPLDAINLAQINIKYDPSLIEVEKIATSAGEVQKESRFNQWLEVVDSKKGDISIIAGLPAPGVKSSDLAEGKAYLATVYFLPKNLGTVTLKTEGSKLYRNSDNQNIFQNGTNLVLNLTSTTSLSSPSSSVKQASNSPVIVITEPKFASNYSYFKPISIIWSAFNADKISQINLYLNGNLVGPIAQNLDAKIGKFIWNPKDNLNVPYIQPGNIYMIEIVATSKTGQTQALSGQFGILGQEEISGSVPKEEEFIASQLTIEDASRLLTNYLVLPLGDKTLDFNKDGVINGIDFYLLRHNLLARKIIK